MIRRYLINKTIYFYPGERKIESVADGRSCLLHTPAALCFVKLLEVNGGIVSQSELQEAGWCEELSRHTTQASYYQCFVNLRKQFCSLGFEEKLLITVPRRGMKINPTLEIESEQYGFPAPEMNEVCFPEEVKINAIKKSQFYFQYPQLKWGAMPVALMAVLITAFILHYNNKDQFKDYQTVEGFGTCYFFKDPESAELEDTVATLEEKGYGCSLDKNFYINKLRHVPRTTFFVCDKASDERCDSVTIMSKKNENNFS